MTTDRELLQRFARHGSEEAFAALVRRHIDLVYGAALRPLRGHLARADEVTAAVFTALAAQGKASASLPHLASWLHDTTRHAAARAGHLERLRQDTEAKVASAHPASPAAPTAEEASGPSTGLLHEVLAELAPADREVVLLRFFGGHSPAAVATILGAGEEAARGQVAHAVEALGSRLNERGGNTPAAALQPVLLNQAVAAPLELATSVIPRALTGAAALAASTANLPGPSAWRLLAPALPWLAGAAAVAALLVAGQQQRAARRQEAEIAHLRQEKEQLAAAVGRSEQLASDSAVKVRELSAKLVEIVSQPPPLRPAPAAEPAPPNPAAELRPARAARLAQFKPLLAAGRPIKGVVVVLVNGKPAQRPVEFVIGRETRIEAVDDGTYVITPALNPDGSVTYQLAVIRRDPATGTDRTEPLPAVTQTPWDPFTVGGPGGRALAFDPDETAP